MKFSITALTILLISNVPSIYYQWYMRWPWFDSAQHLLSGFFVAMLVWSYFKNRLPENKIDNLVIVVGVTTLVGVLWEFAEFIANQILADPIYRWLGIKAYFMGDLVDTVKDLLLDISGATIYYFSYFILRKKPE